MCTSVCVRELICQQNQPQLCAFMCVCVCVFMDRSATMNSITLASAREKRLKVISTQLFLPLLAHFQHMQHLKMMTNIQAHVRAFLASNSFGNISALQCYTL